jgi:hypothetical protein
MWPGRSGPTKTDGGRHGWSPVVGGEELLVHHGCRPYDAIRDGSEYVLWAGSKRGGLRGVPGDEQTHYGETRAFLHLFTGFTRNGYDRLEQDFLEVQVVGGCSGFALCILHSQRTGAVLLGYCADEPRLVAVARGGLNAVLWRLCRSLCK